MPPSSAALLALQRRIWDGSLPLEIRLAPADCRTYADSEPYLVQYPRLQYLAFLIPRLHAFFKHKLIDPSVSVTEAWFEFDSVPLKWHYPSGLLYDLYSGAEPVDLGKQAEVEASHSGVGMVESKDALPWKVLVHFSDFPGEQLIQLDEERRVLLDSFINAVKEADFIRNGNARTVMGMSKEDSDNLWRSVETHNVDLFNSVNNKLLRPPGVTIRHVPIKIYLPNAASQGTSEAIPEEAAESEDAAMTGKTGHIRVVQSLVPLQTASKQPQTLGTALNSVIPTIFPSRRNPLLAQPVLHGAVVPMAANLEDLGSVASYGDGFLHVAVVMLG